MNNQLRSPLGRVRGLGSAKGGTDHWWLQRVTAVALVILMLLFVGYVLSLLGGGYERAADVIGSPIAGSVSILMVIALFWHLKLGGQVIIEDYVHHEGTKLVAVLALTFACIAVGLVSVLAVLSLVVGG